MRLIGLFVRMRRRLFKGGGERVKRMVWSKRKQAQAQAELMRDESDEDDEWLIHGSWQS